MPRKDAQPGFKEAAADRRVQALELRKAGASYRAIGEQLNISEKTAHQDVQRVLSHFTVDGKAIGLTDDGPKLQAVDRLLRISESRRRLLGLGAPQAIDVQG